MIETNFKHTELGLIPHDWEVRTLADVGTIRMCKRIMKYQTSSMGDIPFYKIGTFGKVADAFISKDLYNDFRKKYNYPKQGDILLSAAGTIGRTVVYDGKPAYYQDSNIVWIENNELLVLNKLLFYLYHRINWITDTGTIPRIYNGNISSILFPLPPTLAEQEKIANALSKIDQLINDLGALIEKKKAIKQGTMQDLLTAKRRLKGFTGEWKSVKLGDIGNTYNGLSGKTADDFGKGEANYITFLNVLCNPIIDTTIFESVRVHSSERQNAVHKGDLFFNTSSETPEEVGICAIILDEIKNLYLNSFCFGFRLSDETIDGKYLAYYFRCKEGRDLMQTLAQGATRYNLSKSSFSQANIILPPTIAEQKAIANILSSMDAEITNLEQKRDKYIAIKQGMMQNLLTGKIRLI